MPRNYIDKFVFYPTAEACAAAAAPIFQEKRWRWTGRGIPNCEQIFNALRRLQGVGAHEVSSGRLAYYGGRFGHERPAEKFDRATFDPEYSRTQREALRRLRQHGHARRFYFNQRRRHPAHHRPGHFYCCASAAMRALGSYMDGLGIFADLGCGDSADAGIAAENGMVAYGVDLFPPSTGNVPPEDFTLWSFLRGDVASRIPLGSGLVTHAISQAMVDLIEPEARPNFYAEVYRILAPGGLFVLNIVELTHGHGALRATEKRRCLQAGLKHVGSATSAMIFKKP